MMIDFILVNLDSAVSKCGLYSVYNIEDQTFYGKNVIIFMDCDEMSSSLDDTLTKVLYTLA